MRPDTSLRIALAGPSNLVNGAFGLLQHPGSLEVGPRPTDAIGEHRRGTAWKHQLQLFWR